MTLEKQTGIGTSISMNLFGIGKRDLSEMEKHMDMNIENISVKISLIIKV